MDDKTIVMKKSVVKFIIWQALKDSYTKAGYTTTGDKFFRAFCKRLDKKWK